MEVVVMPRWLILGYGCYTKVGRQMWLLFGGVCKAMQMWLLVVGGHGKVVDMAGGRYLHSKVVAVQRRLLCNGGSY